MWFPFKLPAGQGVEKSAIDQVEHYIEPFVARCTELFKEIGPGKHEIEIRLSFRGFVSTDCCMGVGQYKGGGTSGSGVDPEDACGSDEAFKAFVEGQVSGTKVSADVDGLKAKFTLNVPEAWASGKVRDIRDTQADAGMVDSHRPSASDA